MLKVGYLMVLVHPRRLDLLFDCRLDDVNDYSRDYGS